MNNARGVGAMGTSQDDRSDAAALIGGQRFDDADIRGTELERAKHALAYLTRKIGNRAMHDLLKPDLDRMSETVRAWVAASHGAWQPGTVELVIPGLTASNFLHWYRRTTVANGADAADRETKLRAGHPEHFINHPRTDGIEVIESVGATELPWHVLYRPLPEDADYPAPWDPGYPVRFGAEVVMDGVRVGYSMRQLRDGIDGMHLRCTAHLPQAAPPALVRRHLTHFMIEFRNWSLAARRERDGHKPGGEQP